jgi:hypothetical protein
VAGVTFLASSWHDLEPPLPIPPPDLADAVSKIFAMLFERLVQAPGQKSAVILASFTIAHRQLPTFKVQVLRPFV